MSGFVNWATHGIKRGRSRWNRRRACYALGGVTGLIVTAAVYLVLVSQTAAQGRHIQQLQVELSRLNRENEQMEVKIALAGSIESLKQRSTALGFVLAEQVEFLRVPNE